MRQDNRIYMNGAIVAPEWAHARIRKVLPHSYDVKSWTPEALTVQLKGILTLSRAETTIEGGHLLVHGDLAGLKACRRVVQEEAARAAYREDREATGVRL